MSDDIRVLITGSQGLIGKALGKALREKGFDVVGIDLNSGPENEAIEANLLDPGETQRAVEAARPFSVLVHTAALAHGQAPPPGETLVSVNAGMTRNVLEAVGKEKPRTVFLSSVSVYGEAGRAGEVEPGDDLKPSTDYGRSKMASEEILLESDLEDCDILRLAPVFDDSYTVNARRRVFFPGLPRIKVRPLPSPKHSLCSLHVAVQTVCGLLERPPSGRQIQNVCDPRPYDQREIASWFPGPALPVPVFALLPFYWTTFLLPGGFGYGLRCLYWKLFRSNLYSTEPMNYK